MRTPYAMLLLVASTIASAQDGVLTSNEMPPIGTTFTYRTVQNLAVMDTTPGTNITWDMSGFVPTTGEAPWDVDVLAPTASPHPTAFPTSNYCTFESELPRYNYYDLNSADMERVGSWATQQSTYSDGQIELTFPLQMGTDYTDTWDNNLSSFGGTFNLACIGRGTLVLPNGTHTNVLLTRIVLYEIFDLVQYQWISASNGAQLLLYYPGDGFWVPEAAAYVVDMNIGIEEMDAAIEMRVQGLADDHLQLTYASSTSLDAAILGPNGALLRAERLPATHAPSTWPIDVSGLASGLYFLELRNSGGAHTAARFMKP